MAGGGRSDVTVGGRPGQMGKESPPFHPQPPSWQPGILGKAGRKKFERKTNQARHSASVCLRLAGARLGEKKHLVVEGAGGVG